MYPRLADLIDPLDTERAAAPKQASPTEMAPGSVSAVGGGLELEVQQPSYEEDSNMLPVPDSLSQFPDVASSATVDRAQHPTGRAPKRSAPQAVPDASAAAGGDPTAGPAAVTGGKKKRVGKRKPAPLPAVELPRSTAKRRVSIVATTPLTPRSAGGGSSALSPFAATAPANSVSGLPLPGGATLPDGGPGASKAAPSTNSRAPSDGAGANETAPAGFPYQPSGGQAEAFSGLPPLDENTRQAEERQRAARTLAGGVTFGESMNPTDVAVMSTIGQNTQDAMQAVLAAIQTEAGAPSHAAVPRNSAAPPSTQRAAPTPVAKAGAWSHMFSGNAAAGPAASSALTSSVSGVLTLERLRSLAHCSLGCSRAAVFSGTAHAHLLVPGPQDLVTSHHGGQRHQPVNVSRANDSVPSRPVRRTAEAELQHVVMDEDSLDVQSAAPRDAAGISSNSSLHDGIEEVAMHAGEIKARPTAAGGGTVDEMYVDVDEFLDEVHGGNA